MITLKLKKGLSYSGSVKATRDKPFVVVETAEEAEVLVASGYFEQLEAEAEAPEVPKAEPEPPNLAELEKMDKKQLEAEAERRGIDISGAKNNGERIVAIIEGAGGSITMIDLQEEGG